MGRTPLFNRLLETLRTAASAAPAKEAVEAAQERAVSRRNLLQIGGAAAAMIATPRLLTACTPPSESDPLGSKSSASSTANIGIVGAGIAGLACATDLKRKGVIATIHEAGTRAGGRIWSSMNDPVWGQAFERGGEFIDTPHKAMIGYARELKLQLEDVAKPARETHFYFGGQKVAESQLVDEYRVLVDAMRDDLRALGSPTADLNSAADRALDRISLSEYLTTRGAAPTLKALLENAYDIEYGLEASKLTCLAFLFFAKASRQSKLRLFGNWSDERYHVVGGNQQITDGLAARLSGQLRYGRKLVAVKKLTDGRIELTFKEGNKTVTATHDAVVLTLPFHLLREVQLDASLALPVWKKNAINQAVCGNNAKLMVGFEGRPWVEAGANGTVYSDLPYLQVCWETSPSTASATRGILTDYTGGPLSLLQSASSAQSDTATFLASLDTVLPGSRARARKDSKGKYVCHIEHWPSNPLTRGAYTANGLGYFTTIEGNEAKPVGNLHFGGETTDSFYSWQGFMEGGALSGIRAAAEVLAGL